MIFPAFRARWSAKAREERVEALALIVSVCECLFEFDFVLILLVKLLPSSHCGIKYYLLPSACSLLAYLSHQQERAANFQPW